MAMTLCTAPVATRQHAGVKQHDSASRLSGSDKV
jgi:hypothetical protein